MQSIAVLLVALLASTTAFDPSPPPPPKLPPGPQLMEDAGHGRITEVAALLRDHPESISFASPEGETPLHVGCISGNSEIVKMLINAKADPNARAFGPKSLRMHPLSWCVFGGFLEASEVLIENGADVNAVFENEAGDSITVMDVCAKIGKDWDYLADGLSKHGARRYAELNKHESSEL